MSAALAVQTKGLGVVVVLGEVAVDGTLEVGDAREHAAADALAGDLGEEALDQVEPGGRGWREVPVAARMLRQPCLHDRMLMGGVVVDHRCRSRSTGVR